MPGTIQVTVLEFKGVSSSSKPSAKSLKVSMGKRQYQTWDKGDFSFPITKIRENLVVALLDAGGNEIAHQDIRTMQIIEKGCWDEVFSINGGGHVHLKLQFILSEEDRNRIRTMRESAMKKKLETNPNIKQAISSTSDSVETSTKNEQEVSDSQKRFVEIDVVSSKVDASQPGSSLASATSSAVSLSSLESAIPNATDGSEGAASPDKHEIKIESSQVPDEKIETEQVANARSDTEEEPSSKLQDDYRSQKSKIQDPVERTPSNVRKMISAFENSQLQEVKSLKEASSQLNRLRKGGLLEDQESKADKSLIDLKDHFAETIGATVGNVPSDRGSSRAPEELSSTITPIPSGEKDNQKFKVSAVDAIRQSTSEKATSSGRMPDDHSQVREESSAGEGSGRGRGRGTGLKSSTMIMASNPKPKTLEYYKEEYYSGLSSGMWIFPDNTRRLCITTAGKQVMKMVGHHHSEAKTRQVKKISSGSKNVMHETEFKKEKNQKKIVDQQESGSGSSPDEPSSGIVGQAIKIAVIIGFGVLVLLTRQKEPRKKHRE